MPRAIWKGAISFGLVNVPVQLYTAVARHDIHFHQLHEKDGVRIKQRRWCPKDECEVPFDDIVKGFEVAPDEYVVITKEELDSLDPKASRTIDIEEFVQLEDIDPVYFDHSYLLVPDTGGAKAYALLASAMASADRIAIARVVLRTKQHLVAIRPYEGALAMVTLNYADEVVAPSALDLSPADTTDITKREREMAEQLIDQLTTDFDPTKYHDTYKQRVQQLIEKKAEGERISVDQPVAERTPALDIMAALEQSIAASKEKRTARAKRIPPAKSSTRKKAAK